METVTLLDVMPSLHHAAAMRVDPDVWPLTTRVDVEGRLCVGGVALNDVADQYGTPAYVLDEADFRYRIRRYRAALPGVRITYAGKALLTKQVARWVADEGVGLDVCSPGELATGLAGGVHPRSIVVHGNAKTTGELRAAADAGVGRIVIDCGTEIALLASQLRRPQEVLIRVAPGIDIHGHAAVTTGIVDQKFGFAVAEGQAALAVRRVLDQPLLRLAGLHCHLGSQVTEPTPYGEAIGTMVSLMADVRNRYGVVLTELNIGGGHGVPYVAGDGELDLEQAGQGHRRRTRPGLRQRALPQAEGRRRARSRDSRTRRGDLLPRGVGEASTGRPHVRGGGRRHGRQPAGGALRRPLHGDGRQPPSARPEPDRDRRRQELRGRRRRRPRRAAAHRPASR